MPCFLPLHSPDGAELAVAAEAIVAIRPIGGTHHDHLPKGTRAVLTVAGQSFAVAEGLAAVLDAIAACGGRD